MDIVNKELPRGNKFYALEDYYCVPLASLMHRGNIETLRKAKKIIERSSCNSDYWRVIEPTFYWKLEGGSEEYPIITMSGRSLSELVGAFSTYSSTKKNHYTGSTRLGLIGARYTPEMRIRYDPVRKGLWIYDVEYEGPLVSNKPMVINKVLKEKVQESIKQLAVEALIGVGDEDLLIDPSMRYGALKGIKAERLAELIPKILSGDYETKDLATAAYLAEQYKMKYVSNLGACIDLDLPCNGDVPFTAGARTKLIYHFGGYQLPDDYQEWFDK